MHLGCDATTGKQRWATTTVRGSNRYATQLLTEFVREAEYSKVRAGTIGRPAVEFSWVGFDELDQANGRGWAVLGSDGR